MATIKNEFDYIQEARSQLAEALVNKFGVREQDILNADGSIKSTGLWASNSDGSKNYLKRLHDWAVLVTATNVHTDASLTFKNDGSGDAADTTFNGSVARSISYNSIGAAASNHVHNNLIIKWDTGNTEGTNLFTYNGSTAKTINLNTPFSQLFTNFGNAATGFKSTNITATIGGTTKSFAVNWADYAGRSQTADKWTTARTLTIGSTGKSVNGSKNVSWTLAEIGAADSSHTHRVLINGTSKLITASPTAVNLGSYLPLEGGTMTGAINLSSPNARIAFGDLTTSPITGYTAPNLGTEGVGIYSHLNSTLDEGAIIITEATCAIYNAGDTDWFLQVLDTDWTNATTPDMGRVFGVSVDGTAWAQRGFVKEGSSDSYVLLGGGGHKEEAQLSVNYATYSKSAETATYANSSETANTAQSAETAAASTGRTFWINGIDGQVVDVSCPALVMHWPNRAWSDLWYDGSFHFGLHNSDNTYNNGADLHANAYYADSDIRYKNVIKHSCIDLLSLATLPLFLYTWNDKRDDIIHIGSSAQAVEQVIPQLVTEDSTGFKSLNYSILGTVAGITACKELVSQKSEIEVLKERVKQLEQLLKMYNG